MGFRSKSINGEKPEQSLVEALEYEEQILQATTRTLEDFQQFSAAALNFFLEGFYASPRLLAHSAQIPPQMVLHTLLRELSADLEIYQRSLQQRRLMNGGASKHLFMLSVGDRVAAAALRPAFEAKFLEQSAVITHLGDDFDIRLIPYSQALVIEMPFTAGSILGGKTIRPLPGHEHLALLHEVGHYVYHHGKVPNSGQTFEVFLTQELFRQGITGGLANWQEELFADIYGLLVGGPVMALSYQERLSQESPQALIVDSGDHPISILRPLVQNEVLRMIRAGTRSPYRIAPGLLDHNWSEFLGGRDLKNEIFQPLGVSRPISGGTIVQGLAPIIQKILDSLEPLQLVVLEKAWSKDLVPGKGLGTLTEQLENGGFMGAGEAVETVDATKRAGLVDMYQKMAGRSLSAAEWQPLFIFAGWSTEYSIAGIPSASLIPTRVGDMPSGFMSPTRVGDMPSS